MDGSLCHWHRLWRTQFACFNLCWAARSTMIWLRCWNAFAFTLAHSRYRTSSVCGSFSSGVVFRITSRKEVLPIRTGLAKFINFYLQDSTSQQLCRDQLLGWFRGRDTLGYHSRSKFWPQLYSSTGPASKDRSQWSWYILRSLTRRSQAWGLYR